MSTTNLHHPAGSLPENRTMDSSVRPDQPKRRTINPAQKLAYLNGYEQAIEHGEGGGYLRANGIYSSQIAEWRKLREAGILEGNTVRVSKQSTRTGKGTLSKEQAEIARLKKTVGGP